MHQLYFNRVYLLMALLCLLINSMAQKKIYQSEAYEIYNDKVVQGKFISQALSSTKLNSNYESPTNLYQSANISFKFAINGKDNEMSAGVDHQYSVIANGGKAETPIIVFGEQLKYSKKTTAFLTPNTKLLVRLDMRAVLKQLDQVGYYTCFNGTKIYKQDFKGVFIAGGTLPMIWDFDNLVNHDNLKLTDANKDGIYETELLLNAQKDQKKIAAEWNQSKNTSALPQYKSPYLIQKTLYNLSIEEMMNAVEPDSTLRTGKEWSGVWTRDVSYSIILSMAYLQPQVAMNSLLKKVNKKKRIIQDTGTGGAYPCSTDRAIWAVAAWEIYKVTGNKDWLELAYEIIKNSIEDDIEVAYDKTTGMVKGESSFLDWREQTYPKWMQPADIFESECLGTNAVHYQANKVLSEMALLLNQSTVAAKHSAIAESIKKGINQYLWMPSKGYYAQFIYGRKNKIQSPRSEALGEALCILFGIADKNQAASIVRNTPVTNFGIPCIYPQIPNIPPYHNNAVWPFVQAYWAQATALVHNEKALMESFAAIYRPAALFLTNKENFVAENGDYAGTQINSSNMLWSLSGNISLIHKIIMGIYFEKDGLVFTPFIPKEFSGKHILNGFSYRNALLNIEVEGNGNKVKSFLLDGVAQKDAAIAANLSGTHSIHIIMEARNENTEPINKLANYTSPDAPVLSLQKNQLSWNKINNAVSYQIIKNGSAIVKTTNTNYAIANEPFAEYQVIAIDKMGIASFASEPIEIVTNQLVVEMEQYAAASALPYVGFAGKGFVEISKELNNTIQIPMEIPASGVYAIEIKYANGNGPTNTENKCAIRTVMVNNLKTGVWVFPQRGKGEWSNWGLSNAIKARLLKGKQLITISFEKTDENMNGAINTAMLDQLILTKLKD